MKVGHGTEAKFFNVAERRRENLDTTKDLTTKETGHVSTDHDYTGIHQAEDGNWYRVTGPMTTHGTGANAVSSITLRDGVMQQVDPKDGKVIGERYSSGVSMQGGRIINLEAEKGIDVEKKNKVGFEGNYTGADGKPAYGKFQYAQNEHGAYQIVSGESTNIYTTKTAEQVTTPDGESLAVAQTAQHSGGHQVTAKQEGGDRLDYSDEQKFSGGYSYNNWVSAFLQEKGLDRSAQAAGRVQGAMEDLGGLWTALT
jgi:hypothetical protein